VHWQPSSSASSPARASLLAPPPPPLPRRFRVVETGAELLACTLAIAWLLALALSHLKFISQPGPQEINEPSFWYTTFLLDQGRNPYSPEELPGAAQFFGPLYHGVVLALKPLFGIGYDAHRFLNLLCIAGSLWLLVTRMRRLGSGLGIALLSSTWIYWICLQNIMITARPDALGLLFFLLAIIIPGERRYSLRASAFGLACTFLAFHCKAYFGLALLPTLAGLALLRSWRHAAVAALAFFATLAASIAALDHVFPLCSLETFFMQRNSVAINTSDDISPMHTAMLFERAWPYFLFLAGAALLIPRHLRTWLHQLRQRDPHAIALGLTLALLLLHFAIVYFYMGHNGGALFTYHLHLIFPPLLAPHRLRPRPRLPGPPHRLHRHPHRFRRPQHQRPARRRQRPRPPASHRAHRRSRSRLQQFFRRHRHPRAPPTPRAQQRLHALPAHGHHARPRRMGSRRPSHPRRLRPHASRNRRAPRQPQLRTRAHQRRVPRVRRNGHPQAPLRTHRGSFHADVFRTRA